MIRKIGVTGNIGTGKSTIAWMFGELGAPIIESDKIVHELIEPKTPTWQKLFDRYGKKILLDDGVIDRAGLAEIAFTDEKELHFIENLTHPLVYDEIKHRVSKLHEKGETMVFIEVPLLFEKGWDKEVDDIIVVACPETQQLEHCEEKNITAEEAKLRLKYQLPLNEKIKRADYVIDNSGSLEDSQKQVKHLHKEFAKGTPRPPRIHEKHTQKELPPQYMRRKKGI